MKRYSFILMLLAIFLMCGCSTKVSNILIIGDSISLGYIPFVKETLAVEGITVDHNEGNAQNSAYGLQNIEKWIQAKEYDIIQFNWGLWDLCYRHPESKIQGHRDKVNGKLTATLKEYEQNLEAIVKILEERTKAKLIFVTTSYVPEQEAGRFQEDAQKYNEVAKKVMKRHSIPVNDIFDRSIQIHHQFGLGNDNVHYQDKGYQKLAEIITDYLKKQW